MTSRYAPRLTVLFGLLIAAIACGEEPASSPVDPSAQDARLSVAATDQQEFDENDLNALEDHWIVLLDTSEGGPPGAGVARAMVRELPANVQSDVRRTFDYPTLAGFAGILPGESVEALRNDPRVRAVVRDRRVPSYGHVTQTNAPWGLDRISQPQLPLDGTYKYNEHPNDTVTICVLDTGLAHTHSEFVGRDVEFEYDVFGEGGADCNGHGTFVTSLAAGNTVGVARGVRIRYVKVMDPCVGDGFMSDILDGIAWLEQNADLPAVANMSFGDQSCVDVSVPGQPGGCDDDVACYKASLACTPLKNSTLDQAVESLVASGVSVVAAAGNANTDACDGSPGHLGTVITVGAVDVSDTRWDESSIWGSNFGSCLDVFAPGVDVLAATRTGGFSSITATSYAAPFVTGAVAIRLQQAPQATPAAIKLGLHSFSLWGFLSNIGAGSPNRLIAGDTRLSAGISGPTQVSGPGSYQWNGHGIAGFGHYEFQWYRRDVGPPTGEWEALGDSSTQELTFGWGTTDFELKVEVESAGWTEVAIRFVSGGCEDEICPESGDPSGPVSEQP